MKTKINRLAKALAAPQGQHQLNIDPTPKDLHKNLITAALGIEDPSDPEMERRLRPKTLWEYLDESRSAFYARMNPKSPSYDPLFPKPIPSSSTGRGHKRWKLGAFIAWLRLCEANAKNA